MLTSDHFDSSSIEMGTGCNTHLKRSQANFFDNEVSEEFETLRPHGTPRLYEWLLTEKFRRSVEGMGNYLQGGMVITVCGGSGMEAEFLARAGARVILTDISFGAAKRARERAKWFDLSITPVVADVECLPFMDSTFDVAYVHDGLHHLATPVAGLREMARVSRQTVSVTEPARAAVTALAVRLGLADAREESGNAVARLIPEEVERTLRDAGFTVTSLRRYGMYYRHDPGKVCTVLSSPGLLGLTIAGWRGGNKLMGRFGNKLAVIAHRSESLGRGTRFK
jgi:SAM-dependent methyltransferase